MKNLRPRTHTVLAIANTFKNSQQRDNLSGYPCVELEGIGAG